MITTETNGCQIYRFDNLSAFPRLKHFVSSRLGGLSEGAFDSLNTGFNTGDNNFLVLQNRRLLADAVGIDLFSFVFANQCHSGNIAIADETFRGKGAAEKETAIPNTDALITGSQKVCLAVQVADCVPVLLYDPEKHVAAAIHAGWKGTLKRIVGHALEKMMQTYNCHPENTYAALGPSIGPCCYEVEHDVVRETEKAFGNTRGIIHGSEKPGKYIFDQWHAVNMQLETAGIKASHIETAGICTKCNHQSFFSARAGQGTTGRFAAGIMLL